MGPFVASPVLFDLVAHSVFAANLTEGACDPTVADSLAALGYDRDFDELGDESLADQAIGPISPAPGIAAVELDAESSTLTLPKGVHLDLGSIAKARAADLAASLIFERLNTGCLVDLGGDLRICGPVPEGGWAIGIVESTRSNSDDDVQETVGVNGGGVASSSNAVRRWKRGDTELHHVIDPATGWPAPSVFRLVTVAAPTCVEANALSTAAIVWGEDALFELPQRGFAARLVREDGTVERVGGWPEPVKEQQ
jgi:thiamine biosynthesis lipoprotein